MARFSRREREVEEQLLKSLHEQGVGTAAIEAALKSPAAIRDFARQITTAAEAQGVTVTPFTLLRSSDLHVRPYNVLNREGITTYGLLQCASVDYLFDLRNMGTTGIDLVEAHLKFCGGLTLRGKNQGAAARLKQVFRDPKKAPVMAAACLEVLFSSEAEHFKGSSLGDFARMTRAEVMKVVSADNINAFEAFLNALRIYFKR